MLGSGRDSVARAPPVDRPGVIADPRSRPNQVRRRQRALLPGAVPPLPGTRKEAEALRKWSGRQVCWARRPPTEPALLPRALRSAARRDHGVFLTDLPQAGEASSRGLKV